MTDSADFLVILDRLREKRQSKPGKYSDGATEEALKAMDERLTLPLPGRWRDILRITNGFYDYRYSTYEAHMIRTTDLDDRDLDLPYVGILVGEDDYSSCYVLDATRTTSDGDCPVFHVDHEFGTSEYANISQYLAYVLDVIDEEPDDEDE